MGDIISGCHSECTKLLDIEGNNQMETKQNNIYPNKSKKKISFSEFVKKKSSEKTELFPIPPTLADLKIMSLEFIKFTNIVKIQRFYKKLFKIKNKALNSSNKSNNTSINSSKFPQKSNLKNSNLIIETKKLVSVAQKYKSGGGNNNLQSGENHHDNNSNLKNKNNLINSIKSIKFNFLQDSFDNKSNNRDENDLVNFSSNVNNNIYLEEDNVSNQRLKYVSAFNKDANFLKTSISNMNNITNTNINLNTSLSLFNDEWDVMSIYSEDQSINGDITFGNIKDGNNNNTNNTNKDGVSNRRKKYYFTKNYSGFTTDNHGINKVRQPLLSHTTKNSIIINFSDENVLDHVEIYKCKEGSFSYISLRDLQQYKGVIFGGLPVGYGALSIGKEVYYGEFKNGQIIGYGFYTNTAGVVYEGDWVNGFQQGFGIEKCYDNCVYIGTYERGLKHGVGSYSWSDGSVYEGEWLNDKFDGYVSLNINLTILIHHILYFNH